jgi:hypothetical protein
MKQTYEFRVNEEFAAELFSSTEGKRLGDSVRQIEIAVDDPRFVSIGRLQSEIESKTNRSFFYGWILRHRYSRKELEQAALLRLKITSVFEPAGEECGTEYDESAACSQCGSGAVQVSDLRLDLRKAPRRKDIARTIAHEWIVSQHLAERMVDNGLTGFELRPVRHKARFQDDPMDPNSIPSGRELLLRAEAAGAPHPTGKFWVWLNRAENRPLLEQAFAEHAALKEKRNRRRGKPLPIWYQLIVTSSEAEVVPPTRVGIDPFDNDPKGKYRCPRGDLIGLNLLSEVSIKASSRGSADIFCTRQFVGVRRGVLRPSRIILISPKFWRLIETEKIKGCELEVAHLV